MKYFVCALLLAALVVAEPPRYRETRYRFAREEAEVGNNGKVAKQEGADAPYDAAGFKPTKEFNLPAKQELTPPATTYGVPDTSYGAPLMIYTAPQTEYGVPKAEDKSSEESKEKPEDNEAETIESAEGKAAKGEEKKEKSEKKENLEDSPKNDATVINGQGVYYVLLPNSRLQRVQFQTENDLSNMAYTARLQFKSEDRAPIYYYTAVPQYQPISASYYQAPSTAYYQPSSAAYYQW